MADISTQLQAILDAVYGEDVRGSIHDAIEIVNAVGEKVLSIGTAVTSASSSTAGYYDASLYINNSTWDVWKCTGSAWALQGNIKGAKGDTGATGATGPQGEQGIQGIQGIQGDKGDKGDTGTAATVTVGNVTSDADASVTNSGTQYAAVFDFVLPKGDKGDTGQTGQTGATGATPQISMSASVDNNVGTPSVVVTKTGTDEQPAFNLAFSNIKGIQGETGQTGATGQTGPAGADGTDGVSPEVTIATITGGHSVTITDADHPTGQTFNVMDGAAGAQISFSGDAMIIS